MYALSHSAAMDAHAATERAQAMKNKIVGEARNQVAAYDKETTEHFNFEKNKLLQAYKAKFLEEMRKKTKSIETNYAIAKSNAINASRLEKIQKRQEMIERVQQDVRDQLKSNKASQDKTFITELITQCLLVFLEDHVKVQCRAADMELVKSCLPGAADLYSNTVKASSGATKTCSLTLDAGQLPANCLGGVILTCQNGTIVIDNTIDARLHLAMEQDKPAIRAALFGGILPAEQPKKPERKPSAPTESKPAKAPAAPAGKKAPTKLTVKRLAAENLKNSDLIGSSDAYVILSIVNSRGKRVCQPQRSKVKENGGPNPKWDGVFEFPKLANVEDLTLKLVVKDSDAFLALESKWADELNDDDELGSGRIPFRELLMSTDPQDKAVEIAPGYFSDSSLSMNLQLA